MASLKGLFLGVYASNGLIKTLFLPICYLFLTCPFVLLAIYYYRSDLQALTAGLGKNRSATDILLQLFVSVVAFVLPTRILSGKDWSTSENEGKRRIQQLPYWIPGARHWGNIAFGGERWLKGHRYVVLLTGSSRS